MLKKISAHAPYLLLIALLSYAALTKLLAYQHFSEQMGNQPFPKTWISLLAPSIPVTEILIVFLLTIYKTRGIGFWLSWLFMLMFTLYSLAILSHRFDYIPCSCGGIVEWFGWWGQLSLDLIILTLSIIGAIQKTTNQMRK